MAPSWRKCIFPGCQARQNSTISLFTFPKNEDMKKRWIDFVKRHHHGDGELRITNSTAFLCSQHFTPDSFSNLHRRQLGFTDNPLLLVSGAVPTVSLPPSPVPPTVGYYLTPTNVDDSGTAVYHDGVSSQCKRSRDKMTISVGTQLYIGDLKVKRETSSVGTQLSKNTLVHQRSQGSQACVLSVSICVGTPVQRKSPPSVLSSTRQEPFRPSKRRRLTLDELYDGDSAEVTDPDSTYIPAQSVLRAESTLSQASPSINNVPKYVVDKDCLLQLFEECPVCSSTCEVQKTTIETLLTVYQLCPQCLFKRNWRSQQTEKAVPSSDTRCCTSDPESSAAAITEIIAFSDKNDSSDEESSEVDQGEHNSDSDWELADSEFESDADEEHEKVCRKLCPECGKFINSQMQKAHLCEYKKPYSCLVCGKRFLSEVNLKTHIKTHEDGYKHECKYCCSTFSTRHNKLLHEQSHPPAEKPYQCPDCPEVFAKKLERREHLVTHRGPTRHICLICNMEFSNNDKLERHVAVHTKAKQFVCEVCQRSFTQSSHLKSHIRVHTGEKPYQCQHCDKSFNHNVSRKSHIQRYHGQVPDPGMKVQIEKTSTNESEVEKDETNEMESAVDAEMESSAVDAVEAEPSKDTLCNVKNGGDTEEEKKEDKCTKTFKYSNYYRPTGRPIGRPKNQVVITLEDTNQLKRDENEKDPGNSDSTDEEPELDSDPDFEPAKRRTKKKVGARSCKDRGRCRGKQR